MWCAPSHGREIFENVHRRRKREGTVPPPPPKKKKKKSKPEIRAKCGGKSGKKWSEKIKEELHSRFNLISEERIKLFKHNSENLMKIG